MKTDDPYVSPEGYLTAEAGNHFSRIHNEPVGGQYMNLFDIMLAYGLTDYTEISVHYIPGFVTYESRASETIRRGAEEMALALKHTGSIFTESFRYGIESALLLPVELTPFLGGEQARGAINSMFEWETHYLQYRASFGYTAPIEAIREGDLMIGTAVRTAIRENRFAFAEVYAETASEGFASETPFVLALGGGYKAGTTGILDLAVESGFNNEEPAWGVRLGLTYEIPLFRKD